MSDSQSDIPRHAYLFMRASSFILEEVVMTPPPSTLKVPQFWNPPAYGENGIREFLGQNGQYLVTPEEAMAVGSFHQSKETIYVAVASCWDPEECLPTGLKIFTYVQNIQSEFELR